MSINPLAAHWRERFPTVQEKTYLVSHSLGAVPASAAAALQEMYDAWATLGVAAWDGPWWEAVLEFCATMEAILHAEPGSVVPMLNATRAMAGVASCSDWKPPRNRIVMTDLEFPTNYALWRGCEKLGAEVVVVESEDGVSVPAEKIIEAIDERTWIAPLSHVYFRSAAVQDIKAIAAHARSVGAYTLCDGYQAVGSVPVDVQDLGVDFYCGGGHKWLCAGPGAGYLYVRPQTLPDLEPRLTGWFGYEDPFSFPARASRGQMASGVFRFLDGTPNLPAMYSGREGLRIVREIGVEAISQAQRRLSQRIVEGALARGFALRSPQDPAQRSGMVCLDFPAAEQAAASLTEQGVLVDWRPQCGVRVSPHFYNDETDIERFFEVVDSVTATTASR